MTDIDGTKLQKGDLVLVIRDTVVETPSFLCVYHSIDDRRNMTYYPLTSEGVSLAEYENGEFDNDEKGFFRKVPFTVTNIKSINLKKMNHSYLSGVLEEYYNAIVSRI